jgi:hypothetical protein
VIELRDLARQFGPAGIKRLAQFAGLVDGEKADTHVAQIAAIRELLDRGYGKSSLVIEGDADAPHVIRYEFSWGSAHDSVKSSPVIEAAGQADAADGNGNGTDDAVEIVWATDAGDGSG